uniref:Apolipoprotein D n=1 Tax=Dendroctonus ponderosae TaxID=77166 RepID=A0AAR5PWC5_DENPD
MLRLALLLVLAQTGLGQVVSFGQCPNVTAMDNFEADKVSFVGNLQTFSSLTGWEISEDFETFQYMGKWYELERYFAVFEFGGECVTATYTLNENETITVMNTQTSAITRMQASINGEAKFDGPTNEAKLSVAFSLLPERFAAPYWVLGTDYEHYTVVWSCLNMGFLHSRNAWILARTQTLTPELLSEAHAILDKNNISRLYFIRTNQRNCKDV